MDEGKKILTIGAVIFAICLLLVFKSIPEWESAKRIDDIYQSGVAYLEAGDYEAAYKKFRCIINHYKDSDNLQNLCLGMHQLEIGHHDAWFALSHVKVNEKILGYVPDFEKKKSDAWLLFKKGVEEETAREKEELRTSGIPYVGMPERDIYATSLGAASEKYENFNYETIDGKQYPATKYVWKKYGCIIFTARCCNGQVKNVWDERDNPRNPSGNYGYSSGSGSKSDEPEFDVDFFENAEDFYDHYYDDFIDYYEAEDYFEEHKK